MSNESKCPRCDGLGYVEMGDGSNKICSCKLAESIKNALSKHPNILMSKELKFNIELFPENLLLTAPSLSKVNSILKTVFTYMFLKQTVRSLDVLDSHTLMEAYFDKSDFYSMSSLKEADFVVLVIDGDKQNKILPEVLKNFTTYRKNFINKPTWVVYLSETGRKLEEMSLYAELVKSLKLCNFTFRGIKK